MLKNNPPLLSILMPVFNGQKYLYEAISSVLSQSFLDFELIIIDDGSRDYSWNVISSFDDARIVRLRHSNIGVAATLNKGLSIARGCYISRLDQDDLMRPDRLKKQISFMNNHPEVGASGTWAKIYVDDQPTKRKHAHPIFYSSLKFFLLFDNPFVHSSLIARAEALKAIGGYDDNSRKIAPEDYDLWIRLSRAYVVVNLPEFLTSYREVKGSLSRSNSFDYMNKVISVSSENIFQAVGNLYSKEKCYALASLYHGNSPKTHITFIDVIGMLKKLKSSFISISKNNAIEIRRLSYKVNLKIIFFYFFRFKLSTLKKWVFCK